MKIRILGSCAGGGLPQWNCGGANSVRARAGDPRVPARSQPSIAVSADGRRWCLLNASPDVREQLARFPALHPPPGTREIPLDSVVLTSAELDHTLGLLVMREALAYRVVSTGWVRQAILLHNAAWRLMAPAWEEAKLDESFPLDREGRLEGLFFPVAPKLPPYLRELASPDPETTVGLRVSEASTGRRLVFVPGLKGLDPRTLEELESAELRVVDGTFYTRDELRALRPDAPDALAMGHLPIDGPDGSLRPLAELTRSAGGRTLYIHMNNTNPILDAGSSEAAAVRAAGLEIAADGDELGL